MVLIGVLVCAILGPSRLESCMAFVFIECILGIITASNTFCITHFWLIVYMYRYHRYEFNLHYKEKIALLILTYCSMVILLILSIAATDAAPYALHINLLE